MNKYSSESLRSDVGFSIDDSFGDMEMEAVLAEVRASDENQAFNVGIGGSVYRGAETYGKRIYFGACDKNIYCLALDGKEVWKFSTGDVVCEPAVHNGVVYVGSFDTCVYALNADNGGPMWKFSTDGKVGSKPLFHKGKIYFGSEDGNIYAVNENGGLVWKCNTQGPIFCDIFAHGDRLIIGSGDGCVYCFTPDGELVWKFSTGNSKLVGSAVVHKGTIFVPSTDHSLYALTLDGKLRWRLETGGSLSTMRPGVCEDMIYFGSRDNTIYAVDTEGKLIWKYKTSSMIINSPVVYNDIAYVGSCDYNVYALRARTGELVWKFPTKASVIARALIVNDVIYIGSWDCNLYAITTDGQFLWKFHTALSYTAPVDVKYAHGKSRFELVWRPDMETGKGKAKEEMDVKDYGSFSGSYMKKEEGGYVGSGKRSYIKKRDF